MKDQNYSQRLQNPTTVESIIANKRDRHLILYGTNFFVFLGSKSNPIVHEDLIMIP